MRSLKANIPMAGNDGCQCCNRTGSQENPAALPGSTGLAKRDYGLQATAHPRRDETWVAFPRQTEPASQLICNSIPLPDDMLYLLADWCKQIISSSLNGENYSCQRSGTSK